LGKKQRVDVREKTSLHIQGRRKKKRAHAWSKTNVREAGRGNGAKKRGKQTR